MSNEKSNGATVGSTELLGALDVLREAVEKLLSSDEHIQACSDENLEEARDNESLDKWIRIQAESILLARNALRVTAFLLKPNESYVRLSADEQLEWLWSKCRISYQDVVENYPIEHCQWANKNNREFIESQMPNANCEPQGSGKYSE